MLLRFFSNKPSKIYSSLENIKPCPTQLSFMQDYCDRLHYSLHRFHFFPPKGLYLYGSVGCGKTMIMDTFCQSLNIPFTRIHFAEFMLGCHRHVQEAKLAKIADPVHYAAKQLQTKLLCLDELQITDIADAMLVRLIFENIAKRATLVVTSNRHPDNLYENGIQRESFLPCIELLKSKCNVEELTGIDFRKTKFAKVDTYFRDSTQFEMKCKELWDKELVPKTLDLMGRRLTVKRQSTECQFVRFSHKELFVAEMSSADYITLCKEYKTIAIDTLRPFNAIADRNELRRFIWFIDAAYEMKTKLVLNLNVEIQDLLYFEKGTAESEDVFAFRRTLSRLYEMRSF